jgi:hypothetical protein
VLIPIDEEAEEHIVGMCVATRYGQRLAYERLNPADFYLLHVRRAFEAAGMAELLAAEARTNEGFRFDVRVAKIAQLATVDPRWLEKCVDERPTLVDKNGVCAARVKDASWRRSVMRWAADVHEAAGNGDHAALERLLFQGAPYAA